MIKFAAYDITFQEVPDEVSLTFSISNCTGSCPGCHSPMLHENIGCDLEEILPILLDTYGNSVTCVCFMGEGNDPEALVRCMQAVRIRGLKICLYSGRDLIQDIPMIETILPLVDYLKVGSYRQDLGGLNSPATNQQFYAFDQKHRSYKDIVYRFWKTKE